MPQKNNKLFGLFDASIAGIPIVIEEILNSKTLPLLGETTKWHYDKNQKVAWITHELSEKLINVKDYFLSVGVKNSNIIVSQRKKDNRPILVLSNLRLEKLDNYPVYTNPLKGLTIQR
jgi:hypothetical protein